MTAVSETRRPIATPSPAQRIRTWLLNPWGEPRGMVVITWIYVALSIVPARDSGSATRTNALAGDAPRSRAASISRWSIRSSAANRASTQ